MTPVSLFLIADLIGADLIVRRYANQKSRWMVTFEHGDTKDSVDDPLLTGTTGNGTTPFDALRDYAERIAGKILVLNGGDEKRRREFAMPLALTVEAS